MELFLFDHERYETLYNCSFKTDEEWRKYANLDETRGWGFLTLGTFYIVLYVPILIVMARPKLFRNSCFKIMFFLGIIDVFSTIANCIIPGYYGLTGAIGCNNMTFFYIVGALVIGCWFCQCATCVLLGLNRLLDFWWPHLTSSLFEGFPMAIWLMLAFGYGFIGIMFCTPPIFSSIAMAYFFDPYFLIPIEEVPMERGAYMSAFHSINNIAIVVILPTLHGLIVLSVWWKTRGATSEGTSKMQRKLFMQAFYICLLNFVAASLYVYMQFFPCPMFLITVAQMMWQGSNGGAVLVYLTLNRTIRNGVLELVFCGNIRTLTTSATVTTYNEKSTAPVEGIANDEVL